MAVTVDVDGDGIAVVTMDDGAHNALDPERFDQLTAALDDLPDTATAVVLTGRPGILSAGLDLAFMQTAGADGVHDLLVRFGTTLMRWWTEPRPTVCAAGGHAIAAGTMLAMACDHAVAAEGEFWWGLTETQIDFAMPRFGLALATHNVRNDLVDDLVLPGERVRPARAVEVGYADVLAPPGQVMDVAMARARELAALPARAYGSTKQRLRGDAAGTVLDGLVDDIDSMRSFLGR